LFLISMILCVAIWGDIASVVVTSGSTVVGTSTLGVSYWFADGWQLFEAPASAANAMPKANFIFGFLVFLGCLICITVFSIIGIVKGIKGIVNIAKDRSDKLIGHKATCMVAFFAGLYFVFEYALIATSSTSSYAASVSSIGWGFELYISVLVLFVAAIVVRRIVARDTTRPLNVFAVVRDITTFVLTVIFVLVGFGTLAGIAPTSSMSGGTTALYSPFTFLNVMSPYFDYSTFPTGAFVLSVFSAIFFVVALVFALVAFKGLMIGNRSSMGKVKFFLPAATGLFLIAFILELVGVQMFINFQTGGYGSSMALAPSATAIVGLVFAIIDVVIFFVFDSLSNKKAAASL